MKLLILGGTSFLGRHTAAQALRDGHEVSLFHRGQTNPDLFPDAEHVLGDRNGDLGGLQGRRWDAVIDCTAYTLKHATTAAGVLAGAVGRYVFVSTISVYAGFTAGMAEDGELARLPDGVEESTEEVMANYGALKALCEEALERRFGDLLTVVRPGLIVGPHDPTERFTYWPRRAAEGGEILAPGDPERAVQFIDARDLGAWMLQLADSDRGGVFNATGPAARLTFRELVESCIEVAGSGATVRWLPDEFLLEHEVAPWAGLPLWLPAGLEDMLDLSVEAGLSAGLSFRPLAETVRDTLDWDRSRTERPQPPGQLTRERERELLGQHPEPVGIP